MKLLQLNVWGGRLESSVLGLLKKEQPDIICLQEAVSVPRGENVGYFGPVETLAKELGMHLSYAPSVGFKFMHTTVESGNAVLSKQPIASEHITFTRKEYIKDFDAVSDDYNARNLLHVIIDTEDGVLNVLTHHGHHVQAHKNGNEETMRQCKLIADYASKLKGKVILTGDFNLSPHSESLEQINKVLTNLSIKEKLQTTRTGLTHKTEVCDYIFVSSDVHVTSFKALDDIVSDHKALTVEFN